MKLYLVQHAEAMPKEEDPERPLSDRGRADIEKVAAYLANRAKIGVDVILHSGKTRARQTADILGEAMKPPQGVAQADGLEPLADAARWERRCSEEKRATMLVGHLPHLSNLAGRLLCGDEEKRSVKFTMGGVVCIEKGEGGGWAVAWMLIPGIVSSP